MSTPASDRIRISVDAKGDSVRVSAEIGKRLLGRALEELLTLGYPGLFASTHLRDRLREYWPGLTDADMEDLQNRMWRDGLCGMEDEIAATWPHLLEIAISEALAVTIDRVDGRLADGYAFKPPPTKAVAETLDVHAQARRELLDVPQRRHGGRTPPWQWLHPVVLREWRRIQRLHHEEWTWIVAYLREHGGGREAVADLKREPRFQAALESRGPFAADDLLLQAARRRRKQTTSERERAIPIRLACESARRAVPELPKLAPTTMQKKL